VFIGEHRFAGVDEVEVTDELKVLAAASAVMLLFNRPDLEYQRISEVLFYPGAFSEESFSTRGIGRETIGMNNEFGAVILSAPELRRSFESQSGRHVGLHEFAHALDRTSAQTWNGIPPGMSSALVSRWTDAVHAEQEKLDRGYSQLDQYARTNLVEFFAVAVETYFGLPELLRRDSTELFDVLDEYFRADPKSDEPPLRNKRRPEGR
jgi:Mlc titration factor MtfA (ptsG expression regulator)